MARGKAIQVKIPTAKIITALEAKLAKTKADYSKQDEYEATYKLAQEAWSKALGKWALDKIADAKDLRTNYRSYNRTLNVDFDLIVDKDAFPPEPEKEYEEIHRHVYNEMVEEMSNAIRILQMTDEEVVNTSTYNAIARYL